MEGFEAEGLHNSLLHVSWPNIDAMHRCGVCSNENLSHLSIPMIVNLCMARRKSRAGLPILDVRPGEDLADAQ